MKKASHTDLTEKLGQKIRIERMKRKMSQEKLAELAELNRNFIGMVERGESNITGLKTLRISQRLLIWKLKSYSISFYKFFLP